MRAATSRASRDAAAHAPSGGPPPRAAPARITRPFFFLPDPAFLAGEQLRDVRAMPPDQQHAHREHRPGDRIVVRTEQEHVENRREHGRDQRRERRVAKEERDDEPRERGREAEHRMHGEQHARRGRDALAALEAEKHRIQVTEEHRDRRERDADLAADAEALDEPDREPALERIADEREDRRLLVAAAQHVGRAGILRAVRAGVGEPHRGADDDGE